MKHVFVGVNVHVLCVRPGLISTTHVLTEVPSAGKTQDTVSTALADIQNVMQDTTLRSGSQTWKCCYPVLLAEAMLQFAITELVSLKHNMAGLMLQSRSKKDTVELAFSEVNSSVGYKATPQRS